MRLSKSASGAALRRTRSSRKAGRLVHFSLPLDPRTVEIARRRTGSEPAIRVLRADAFDLPFDDDAFDVATASLFLHHFDETEATPDPGDVVRDVDARFENRVQMAVPDRHNAKLRKVIELVKRPGGQSLGECHTHWRERHGPIVARLPGLRRYVQSLTLEGGYRQGELPYDGIAESDREEFNRQMDAEFRYIRDFIIMHYHVTERTDSEFWRRCRDMGIPDSLQHRLDLFRDTGLVFETELDIFRENSWNQVMLGQGIEPKTYHPIVDMMDERELRQFMQIQGQKVDALLSQLPGHREFVNRYCPTGVT